MNEQEIKTIVDLSTCLQNYCHEGHSMSMLKVNGKRVKHFDIKIDNDELDIHFDYDVD